MNKDTTIEYFAEGTTIPEAEKIVLAALQADVPVMLWGPPGVGKTDVLKQVSRKIYGKDPIILPMSLLAPTDLSLPYPNVQTHKLEVFFSDMLPTEGEGLIILDDLNTASSIIQAQAYFLLLERKLGTYVVPKGYRITATGNRVEDRGVYNRMPVPLISRMVNVTVRPDLEAFISYCYKNNINPYIIGFLRAFNQYLLQDPKTVVEGEGMACPRSYAMLSKILEYTDSLDAIVAVIGRSAGGAFKTFLNLTSQVPNPEDILEGKNPPFDTNKADVTYALVGSIAKALKSKYSQKRFENFFKYATSHFDIAFQAFAIKDVWKTIGIDKVKIDEIPGFSKWAVDNGEILLADE
jgi:hypothetical protein